MASSWDPAVEETAQAFAASEAKAAGIRWTFTPMVDIARDARWGRIQEGAGEDPYLGAAMARAQTLTIIETPPISASGLAGSRVDAMRAGIKRTGFMGLTRWHRLRGSTGRLFRPGLALRPDTAYNLCDASPQ